MDQQSYYTVAQIRELEGLAKRFAHLSENDLMAAAGQASWQRLCHCWPEAQRLVVVCGVGNNGGDGYVLATLAAEAGRKVTVLTLGDHTHSSLVAQSAATAAKKQGVTIQPFDARILLSADVIVDAIFGIGLQREIQGAWAQAIREINQSAKPILSLDLPSGLAADTGCVQGVAIEATQTITFIGLKPGLVTGQGPNYVGQWHLNTLSIDDAILRRLTPCMKGLSLPTLLRVLPPRLPSSHKGDYGHVLVVGGEIGFGGAVRLAAEAALYAGAGLVSVATRKAHINLVTGQRPEIMTHGVEDAEQLAARIASATVIVLGPGLGQTSWSQMLFSKISKQTTSLVLDADGLNLLAKQGIKRDNWVLTPHPGEAGRLLGVTTATVVHDRLATVTQLQQRYGGTILLKGAGTLVKTHRGDCFVCSAGDPAMASGGMGDILSGVIAALIAQGCSIDDATRLGVCVHATAGQRLARRLGQRGLMALELLPEIRSLINTPLY